jgi:hypothetical protein
MAPCRPGYKIPGWTAVPPGVAEEVRRRSQGSPFQALDRDPGRGDPQCDGATTPAASPVAGGRGAMRTFPQVVAGPLAAAFFASDAPIVEITDAGLVPEVRAKCGIPMLIHGAGFPAWTGGVLR